MDNSVKTIQPHEKEFLGPIIFKPSDIGRQRMKLILRNNLNYYEEVLLEGESIRMELNFTKKFMYSFK